MTALWICRFASVYCLAIFVTAFLIFEVQAEENPSHNLGQQPFAVQLNLSDGEPATSSTEHYSVYAHFGDLNSEPEAELPACYPNAVSHDPGWPRKPLIDRPGDRNRKDCPPPRYCLPDCERAGYPHEVAWWAKPSVTKHYSAWFVGGGTPWILPLQARGKLPEEGTWGLDYDGLFRPRRVWMAWSCDREQGGLAPMKRITNQVP